ncbi:hypothetical protein [Hungatella hathewayi]|uniref:hypothetical protein n=1 Tax=Hungatella hathewayi TaxID=154046 RepID=UPI0035661048
MEIDKLVSSLIWTTLDKKINWAESLYAPRPCIDCTSFYFETPNKRVIISKCFDTNPIFDDNAEAEYVLSIMPLNFEKTGNAYTCERLAELFDIIINSTMKSDTDVEEIINYLNNL